MFECLYWATLQKCVRVQHDCPNSALLSSYLLCELQANVKGRFRVSSSGSGFGFPGRGQFSGFQVGVRFRVLRLRFQVGARFQVSGLGVAGGIRDRMKVIVDTKGECRRSGSHVKIVCLGRGRNSKVLIMYHESTNVYKPHLICASTLALYARKIKAVGAAVESVDCPR